MAMISPGSRLAILIATLIVAASANVIAVDRTAPAQRFKVVRNKLNEEDKQRWISAISNDHVQKLRQMQYTFYLEELLMITAENGKSALMVASKKGDLIFAKRLVAAGASIHQTTITQGTALMFAVLGNQRAVLEWLVEQGAEINAKGSNGWSALTIAAAKGNSDLLRWLLAQGADAQTRDVYRYTPLLRAVDNGFLEVSELLLQLPDTDIHAYDEYNNTALHHAVSAQNVAMIKLLLQYGADVKQTNKNGLSSLDLAKGNSLLVDVLNQPVR